MQVGRKPVNCLTNTYGNSVPTFHKGDKICFKLRVDFPNIETKNAVVTDFLPPDTEYLPGTATVMGDNNVTVASGDPAYADVAGPLIWTLGNTIGGDLFVPANKVFEVVFAVRVLDAAGGVAPEITGNLMKMRTENTNGEAESYRDQADFNVAPPPDLSSSRALSQPTNRLAPRGQCPPPPVWTAEWFSRVRQARSAST